MNYTQDSQFITRIQNLVRELLSDEARYVERNDSAFLRLHEGLFSNTYQSGHENLPIYQKTFFHKYFFADESLTSPRLDMPFVDSQEDQAFFFDQFHSLISHLTYNYDRMDFVLPSFPDEKAMSPVYSDTQALLLSYGIVYPCLAALEQRQMAKLEKRASGTASDESVSISSNPYAGLGDMILLMGPSGEYDQILTYAQLVALSEKEISMNQQGLSTDTRYQDLLREMKTRLGRQVQYDAIQASGYNLAPTTEDFQIINANGITTTINGMMLTIDQAGQGQNAVFFLRDRQGVSARFSIPLDKLRNGEKPPLNLSIYQTPSVDSPSAPHLDIGHDEMDKLRKALLVLYAEVGKTPTFHPATGKPEKKPDGKSKDNSNDSPDPGIASLIGTKPLPDTSASGRPDVPHSPEQSPPTPISVGYTPHHTVTFTFTQPTASTPSDSQTTTFSLPTLTPLPTPPRTTPSTTSETTPPTPVTTPITTPQVKAPAIASESDAQSQESSPKKQFSPVTKALAITAIAAALPILFAAVGASIS